MEIIDTHIHIWDLSVSPYAWLANVPGVLQRSYLPETLDAPRRRAGVTAGILVQADNTLADTRFMVAAAKAHPWIKGVVGWLPLMEPFRTQTLIREQWQEEPCLVGVRHLIHDEPDPRWLLQPTVLKSLELLAHHQIPFDVVGVLPEHIKTALELSRRLPGLRMVFDHMNQPPVKEGVGFGIWGALMQEAAAHKNFYVKISGLGGTAGKERFTAAHIQPYVQFIFDHFGWERCFCGGDWPVSLLGSDYVDTWAVYKEVVAHLVPDKSAQKGVFSENASAFYRLEPSELRR